MNIYNVVANANYYKKQTNSIKSFNENMKLSKKNKKIKKNEEIDDLQEELLRAKISRIMDRIRSGYELDIIDLEFLREHSPEGYKLALEAQKEREEFARELEQCKSKEEVKKVKLKKDLKYLKKMDEAERQGNKGEALKQITYINTVQNELNKFVKTKEFKELPDKNKDNKLFKNSDGKNVNLYEILKNKKEEIEKEEKEET